MTEHEINKWNMLMHLSPLVSFIIPVPFGNIILPLLMWQMKKDEDDSIDDHGKEVINWQISALIYFIILFMFNIYNEVLEIMPYGASIFLLMAIVGISIMLSIFGAFNAYRTTLLEYPYSIKFVK